MGGMKEENEGGCNNGRGDCVVGEQKTELNVN